MRRGLGAALALYLALSVSCGLCAAAQEEVVTSPIIESLWPSGAPSAVGNEPADKPSLTIYLPPESKANGAAAVICPGGGYRHLAFDHEGHQVARWLISEGIAAFILKYRLAPRYRHPVPLQDAKRAVRTVRARAREWKIDANRIGILGFSAGGHLACTVGTHFDKGKPDAEDPIERVSCRPDFMVLIYGGLSLKPEYARWGAHEALFGDKPDLKLVETLSNETQVTDQTPPTFLAHTSEDEPVPAENSVLFYLALRKAGIPAEMHVYEKGKHGFGLAPDDPVLSTWPRLCIAWMRARGVLEKK